MSTARVRASLLALLAIAAPALSAGAERYDSRLRFRTIRTEHFDVHAHQGEERLARRLADTAERVSRRFAPTLGLPRGRVQVVLVDQTDVANGWATPLPYDEIEIAAMPPLAEDLIGNTTDWLELVFTHEYTHILHLDRSRGFMQGVRRVFGRAAVSFPNTALPIWQIEGIATYEESRMTGEGRVPAGDFRTIVDTAARARRFAPIDRASGGLDDWPGGNAPYAYGAYFHQYLADRFGADRIDALADATAGRLPLFGAGAFHALFGASASTLWRDFRQSREVAAAGGGRTDRAARRLTRHGEIVAAPRVGPDGAIYYRIANGDGFPALMRLDGGRARRLAWRAAGDRTSVRGEWVVFDQLERARAVALYADLYAVPRSGGRVRRLTREARAAQPDLSPDGRRIACVVETAGRHVLAVLDFAPDRGVATPRVLVDDEAADYGGPVWSPEGTRIAVERRREGRYELALVDPDTREVRTLVSRRDARLITPSWAPDGRTILFAANVGGGPFNAFAVDVRSGAVRRLTDAVSGAQFPQIGRDGSLVYLGYTADGYDLFSLPAGEFGSTPDAVLPGFQQTSERDRPASPAPPPDPAGLPFRRYNPLPTLRPTFWEPVIETDAGETVVGAATAMSDALGRHAYAASAAWSRARARPDWRMAYVYDRWRPSLFASYSDDTDPVRGGALRDREIAAGALLPFRRVRWSQTVLAAFDSDTQALTCASGCRGPVRRRLNSLRGGWLYDGRRLFRRSISTEEGAAVEAAIETSRGAFGSDADAGAAVLDVRAFHRVLGGHRVLAVRFATASSWGDAAARRVFSASGPGGSAPAFDFGRGSVGLLRGFDREDVTGTHAAVVNVDLRFPLLRVQRGPADWPIFIRSVHAAAFADAGSAWDGRFHAGAIRRSAGGELSLDVVLVHGVPLTIAGGGAWTRDPVAGRDRAAAFARLGYAF